MEHLESGGEDIKGESKIAMEGFRILRLVVEQSGDVESKATEEKRLEIESIWRPEATTRSAMMTRWFPEPIKGAS